MSYVVVVVITDMYKMGMVLVCVLGAAGSSTSITSLLIIGMGVGPSCLISNKLTREM